MKKFLLFSIAQLFVLLGMAQEVTPPTSLETALDLAEGENSYTLAESQGSTTLYYKYTSPENSATLLKLVIGNSQLSPNVAEDPVNYVGYISPASGFDGAKYYVLPAGKTIYVGIYGYGVTEYSFTAELTPFDETLGTTMGNPVELTAGEVYIPSFYAQNGYTLTPVYAKYTATETGMLSIAVSTSVSQSYVREGLDGTDAAMTSEYKNGTSYLKCDVEEGKTYYLSLYSYSPLIAKGEVVHLTEGTSSDAPYEGKNTGNVLPAAAGTYWYKYTVESDGFLTIQTEATLDGGTVSVYKMGSTSYPLTSVTGSFGIRYKATADTYLVSINKTAATAQDETFAFVVEGFKDGDSFSQPIVIGAGTHVTPAADGTYYYQLDVPTDGKPYFINVQFNKSAVTSYNTYVQLYWAQYEGQEPSYLAYYGDNGINQQVQAGAKYYLLWSLGEGTNEIPFTVAFNTVEAGDTPSDPITATTGENVLKAGATKYYDYTATKACWVSIDTDPGITVDFMSSSDTYASPMSVSRNGTVTKKSVAAGEACHLRFTNVSDETTFSLTEVDFQDGEVCDMAVPVEADTTALAAEPLDYWYVFTATQRGVVEVSSDINYEYAADFSGTSNVYLLADGCTGYPTGISQSNSQGTVFQGSVRVSEGQNVLIHVKTYTAQEGKSLIITMRDFENGEDVSCPIELTPGQLTFDEVQRNAPVWYHIYALEGDLSLSASSYLSGCLYKDSTESTPVLYGPDYSYDYETYTSTYAFNYKVEAPAHFYFYIDGCYSNTNVNVVATEIIEAGETALAAAPQTRYYAFVAPKAGKLNVTSSIDYEQDEAAGAESGVWVYAGTLSAEATSLAHYDEAAETTLFGAEFMVEAGDTLYVKVSTLTAQADKALTLALTGYGEDVSLPIELKAGDNLLPAATEENPVWCHLSINQNAFTISSESFLDGCLYKGAELTPVTDHFDATEGLYSYHYGSEDVDDFYLKLVNGGTESTVTVTLVPTGIEAVADREAVKADAVFDLSGRLLQRGGLQGLPAGIYVVKSGKQCRKVLVK